MHRLIRGLLFLVAPGAVACGVPAPPVPDGQAGPTVAIEPPIPSGDVPLGPGVVRFAVADLAAEPRALLLLEGALGDYHVGRIRAASLPSTLVSRLVRAVTFRGEDGATLVLAPEAPLRAGATYSLAALGHGLLVSYQVDDEAEDALLRMWPPREAPAGGVAVYCGPALPLELPSEVELAPAGLPARVARGADARGTGGKRCLRLELPAPGAPGFVLPPVAIQGVSLDPAPLVAISSPGPEAVLDCGEGELPFGALCARAFDDHVVVRAGRAPMLLAVQAPSGDLVEPIRAGQSVVIGGLPPAEPVTLVGTLTDLAGVEEAIDVTFVTQEPMAHVVLNEVLADSVGPEPAQEWIEIVNDAATEVSLAGFTLEDASGASELPPARLGPGCHALVVPAGFDATSAVDVAPAAGTPLLRVPRLGGNGLSNSGEALVLRDALGQVISRFPNVAPRGAGRSVIRRSLRTPDDALADFTVSTEPTPGWSNSTD